MSCCRIMAHMVKQFAHALRQGFMEFCARGCILGSQYLVKPNYHRSERCLWLMIFLMTSAVGFNMVAHYLKNYSENVFRVVYEDHGRDEPFRFPSVGICQLGTLDKMQDVERVLNNSILAYYPNMEVNYDAFKRFLNVMAFQGLHKPNGSGIRNFVNYTQTLPSQTRLVFDHLLDYRDLVEKIRSSCEQIFHTCLWGPKKIRCCKYFREISTTLGKCYMFNSLQNFSLETHRIMHNIKIYDEPYRLVLTFKKPAQIFLLNHKDIPEAITPIPRHLITERNMQLSLEFTIIPTVNDLELADFPSSITKCVNSYERKIGGNKTYVYRSYTSCITDCFVQQQWKTCGCINLYHSMSHAPTCKISQYACLEEHGFINPVSMRPMKYPFCRQCQINCEDADYLVENLYYKFNTELKGRRSLELILLNFPTKHKRRQVIRQPEDKLVSLSGILCLFLGGNVVNIIEFLYLCVRALVRRPANNIQLVAAGHP